MNVFLLNFTPEPEVTIALAARTCYSKDFPRQISREKAQSLIRELLRRGHESVLEHASFTFQIEGISRVASHQLVRHRLASYAQQSQRYVSLDNADFVFPPSVKANPKAEVLYREATQYCRRVYEEMVALGIPREDARYSIPQGTVTNLVFTANARELLHVFRLRLCNRAQWEIRDLCLQMLQIVKEKAPALFEAAGPPCIDGFCPEGENSCGQPWRKDTG
ncbi:MAG: FAD-dependent thymidylate synthase [Candidatus Caldatribacteriaceae bacterium]